MNPSERQAIERILREQAAAANATGDLDFLGYTYPNVRESGPDLSPIPQVDAAGFSFVAAPIEPDRYEWAAAGGTPRTNPEQVTANVARALTKGITGRNPLDEAYDPDLTVGQALEELGVTGLNNIIGQVGFAVFEPGPFDLLPAFGALIGIPKVLQEMIAKRVHPSLIDFDGLPMQMYRGERVVNPGKNTHVSPNYTSQLRGGHHTPDPYYAGDFTEVDHMPRGNYQIGANIRMESPAVSRVLEVRGTRPIQSGEAADLKRAIESLYGSSVSGETLSETLRYIDDLEAAGRPFDLPEMDRIYAELDFDYKKRSPHRNAAVGPTRMDLLTRAGYEGYSDLGNIFEHEFLTFDPGRNLIRANHPEDAIEWLSRRPDLSEAEANILTEMWELHGTPKP